ncbi:PAS-PAC-PAC sensing histidine kinase [Haloferax elongans ATCC BAA-1513]|uniref:histidine kinase n=1 Tax=Haloferax elongans ATCC BAA-1513 TaxID=1230453 RepID=M0HEL1_HALEO|nr:HAMP domain-containing sensor histidine kinase [Haloferax elongans]ELZ82971.1 PAS-PAC-PAC sensing histidine kinase [Haloferax elongans ATCC BAA-1513]
MDPFGDGALDNQWEDELSIVEYALQITDTVIWVWDLESDAISLYPPSQTTFGDISDFTELLRHIHSADQSEVIGALETALGETGTYLTEFRLVRDEVCWVRAKGVVEYDDSGTPTRVVGVSKDVTDRVQREQAFTRLGEHVEEAETISDIGGWELDLETNELLWTDGARRIHDVPPEYEPSLSEALEFYHPNDRPILEQAIEDCREYGEPYNVEIRLITAEGRERWVNCRGERTQRGDSKILRGVIRDVTEWKIRDQRLMVLNRILRHNIRNSLGVVMGNADLLREDLDTLEQNDELPVEEVPFSVAEAQSRASKIKRNAEQLAEIAERARRLSRILERNPPMNDVPVWPLVNRVASAFEAQYPTASVRVEGRDVSVRGDTESLKLALNELLENAIHHTQKPCQDVGITISKETADRVEITVADTGPGIPTVEQEVLEKGFEEPLMHGHGMGLWMVNWLLVRLGGSISIEENDPTGTVVTLTLPAAPSS